MGENELLPHLFRTEYSKIVAVLTRHFGFDQVEIAEDIASETFVTATQVWGVQNIPPNPTGWLYQVAKNKAKNALRREAVYRTKVVAGLARQESDVDEPIFDLSPSQISDSQLQMMFAVCHPAIPREAQVGLALRILCGFGIQEIADAFLTSKDTISKRLLRAREKLRQEKVEIAFPATQDLDRRLDAVLTTLYLLFNEGYYPSGRQQPLRKDLCFEAIRLCSLLVESPTTNLPCVNALLALMCFHASRLDARLDTAGQLIAYHDQDPARWNMDLVTKGAWLLRQAAQGDHLSRYHLEAGIAFWHTQHEDTAEKWEGILQLYDQLLALEYSPVAAMNRAYAVGKARSRTEGIREAKQLGLTDNYLYYALLGELYAGLNNPLAILNFEKSLAMAPAGGDLRSVEKRLQLLRNL